MIVLGCDIPGCERRTDAREVVRVSVPYMGNEIVATACTPAHAAALQNSTTTLEGNKVSNRFAVTTAGIVGGVLFAAGWIMAGAHGSATGGVL